MLMEAVIILWLYLSSLRSSWSITPGLICWLLHGSALIATWLVVVWLWHQAILQQPITLVQISNPFGVKTLYLSHAIHSHCIHLCHRCSCFFQDLPEMMGGVLLCIVLPLCAVSHGFPVFSWCCCSLGSLRDGAASALAVPGHFNFSNLKDQCCQHFTGTALSEHEVFKLGWFSAPW